jgi:hypothetical protein
MGRTDRTDRKTRLRIELKQLELARGHDGFLRGAPEPVLVAGTYLIEQDAIHVLARSVCRVFPPNRFPCAVAPREPELVARWVHYRHPAYIAVLVVAVEEDGGLDVQRVYAALERRAALTVWPQDEAVPAPVGLEGLEEGQARVNIMIDGADLAEPCESDNWVDAAALVVRARSPQTLTRRLPLVSADGRNDWTAELGLYV